MYYTRSYSSFGLGGSATPVVRKLLIANVAVFFLAQLVGDRVFGFTPWFGLAPYDVAHGAVWQIATYMFLHGGLWHLLFNMLALWIFGGDVEAQLGSRRFLIFYLFCGVGAGLCTISFAWGSHVSVVGASGAIFGVLIAFAIFFPYRPITLLVFFVLPVTMQARWFVALFAGISALTLLSMPGPQLGHIAHLGGLFFGWLYLRGPGFLLRMQTGERQRWVKRQMKAVNVAKAEQRGLQEEVDELLGKISKHGIAGLTIEERRRLEEAAERLKSL